MHEVTNTFWVWFWVLDWVCVVSGWCKTDLFGHSNIIKIINVMGNISKYIETKEKPKTLFATSFNANLEPIFPYQHLPKKVSIEWNKIHGWNVAIYI